MFPYALDANGYPIPGFLKGSKITLECYDDRKLINHDRKLINHGSIKLRLQHYSEKSFQDHSFYVVETKTLKPIIIGHPVSIRLGLIWVLFKNISKSVLAIKKTENSPKNSFQDHWLNIDSKTPWKWQREQIWVISGPDSELLSRPWQKVPKWGFFQDHPPEKPR